MSPRYSLRVVTDPADSSAGHDEPSSSTRFATEIVFEGVAGAVGYAIGGAAGGVIGSIGGDVFARAHQLDRAQLARKVERIEQTVIDGAGEADMTWQDFDAALQSDALQSERYARVLEAAGPRSARPGARRRSRRGHREHSRGQLGPVRHVRRSAWSS